ncbi:MAG TPA: rhomboid family intramembrane serine protease [Streptosporangiaceae bacterium]|nr:rhomboid family intramembrane serine protease [Streptosporangiaceae bacterium]
MVIPVHDVNPLRRTPLVTIALVVANIVVFLIALAPQSADTAAGQLCRQAAFYDEYAAIPRELIDNEPLRRVPSGEVRAVGDSEVACATERPDYRKIPALSVLWAMFLHGGWLHLLGNMLFLWIFGNNVEDRFGRIRYLLFYVACGYAATYGFALADPESTTPLVGASGAVAGVLGAYLVLFPRARVWSLVPVLFFIPLRLPAWFVLGLWFVLQWFYSAGYAVSGAGSVAYLAHVVGFLTGMLLALLIRLVEGGRPGPAWREPPPRRPRRYR